MIVKRLQHWTFVPFLGPLQCLSFNALASRWPFPRRFYMDVSSIAFWAEACFFFKWMGSVSWIHIRACRVSFISGMGVFGVYSSWHYLLPPRAQAWRRWYGSSTPWPCRRWVVHDPCFFSPLGLLLFSSWISLLLACTVLFLISLRWAVPRWN